MKTTIILFLFVLVSSCMCAQNSSAVQHALRSYDYEKALALLSKERHSPEQELQTAKCLRCLNRFGEAIAHLLPLSKTEDGDVSVLIELAQCYESLGNWRQASFFYRMGLDLLPGNTFLSLKYLNATFQLREWTAALRLARLQIKTDTLDGVLPLMGDCYMQLNRTDSAQLYYAKSLRRCPTDYATLMKLAKICVAANKTNMLLAITQRYRETDSLNAGVNLYEGIAHFMNKDYGQATYRLCKVRELGDSTFLTHYYLGAAQLATENYADAYTCLKSAYRQDSSNITIHYYLAKAGVYSGHSAEVKGLLKRALTQLIPNDTVMFNYNYLLSDACERTADFAMQAEALKACYSYRQSYKFALYRIASLYDFQLKMPDLARDYYRRFASFRPKQSVADGTQGISYYSVAENRANELQTDPKHKEH